MEILLTENPEREKYLGIYLDPSYSFYGRSNHGKEAIPFVVETNPKTLLDVGCGHNNFKEMLITNLPTCSALGLDFACPTADVIADIISIPFEYKQFDMVTCFDVLEQLPTNLVMRALFELSRVSKKYIFSISYVESVNKWKGQTLHPTVRDQQWWLECIKVAGGKSKVCNNYIIGEWSRPCFPNQRIAVVGNGPSNIMNGERGIEIDQHDHVIRFNRFAIRGFEQYVGTKTTLWSTYGSHLPVDEDQRPQRMLYLHGEQHKNPAYQPKEMFGIESGHYRSARNRVRVLSKKPLNERIGLLPTSGLVVILWLIEQQMCTNINVYGLDFFKKEHSKKHHYWVPRHYAKPTEHDGDAEYEILKPYIDLGILILK